MDNKREIAELQEKIARLRRSTRNLQKLSLMLSIAAFVVSSATIIYKLIQMFTGGDYGG